MSKNYLRHISILDTEKIKALSIHTSFLKIDTTILPLFFQISYLLAPKIVTCLKYFLDKKISIAAIVDSNHKALSSSDVLGT